jgi:putative membrane protein
MLLAHVRSGDPWAFHAHPDVWLVVGLLVGAYLLALRRLGPRLAPAGKPAASSRQRLVFGIGAVLIYVFAEWPIHDISEGYLFWVHMVQHTVFSLVAPPLLLLGTPGWLLSWLIRPVAPVLRRLCRPIPATLLFNGVIAVSHSAQWVNYVGQHELAHFLAHVLLFGSAVVMWLPIVHRLPELVPMSTPVRMVYLFMQSVLPNVPTAFLTFAEHPIYSWYASAPRISGMSAVIDQQTAGAIMKVGGTTIIWTTIVVLFFRWYQETQRDQGDVLTWDDVRRDFERTDPAPTP